MDLSIRRSHYTSSDSVVSCGEYRISVVQTVAKIKHIDRVWVNEFMAKGRGCITVFQALKTNDWYYNAIRYSATQRDEVSYCCLSKSNASDIFRITALD